ncbi:FeoA domain-containing protein [bacterium]|nr:FeoA domain-containing protein [bacterium]
MHKLTRAKVNINLIFASITGGWGVRRKLTDMGLIPGERLKVLHNSGHGPITVLIKGSKIALGYGIADKIIVEEE